MNQLLAFHGNYKIQKKYLNRVRIHREADEIISGQYWENGKGCAVGCTLHSNKHSAYEDELGIPQVLARLQDKLFEGLWATESIQEAKDFPEQFLLAPRIGADLSMVWPRYAHWMLVDPDYGVLRFAKKAQAKKAIQDVGNLYAQWISGTKPQACDWQEARAAYAAAYAAADAPDAAAARKLFYKKASEQLLKLMSEAPVPDEVKREKS